MKYVTHYEFRKFLLCELPAVHQISMTQDWWESQDLANGTKGFVQKACYAFLEWLL